MVETIFVPQNYSVALPFQPTNGGRGFDLSSITTAPSAGQLLPGNCGQTFQASNDGFNWYWIAFGDQNIAASCAWLPVPPGILLVYTLPNDISFTHFSVVTRTGNTSGTLNFGLGT